MEKPKAVIEIYESDETGNVKVSMDCVGCPEIVKQAATSMVYLYLAALKQAGGAVNSYVDYSADELPPEGERH